MKDIVIANPSDSRASSVGSQTASSIGRNRGSGSQEKPEWQALARRQECFRLSQEGSQAVEACVVSDEDDLVAGEPQLVAGESQYVADEECFQFAGRARVPAMFQVEQGVPAMLQVEQGQARAQLPSLDSVLDEMDKRTKLPSLQDMLADVDSKDELGKQQKHEFHKEDIAGSTPKQRKREAEAMQSLQASKADSKAGGGGGETPKHTDAVIIKAYLSCSDSRRERISGAKLSDGTGAKRNCVVGI